MALRHAYVHVPFCARRCSYCDFAIAVRREVPVAEFLGALRREMELRLRDAPRPMLDTLYFGGGTPSRLGGDGVARLMDLAREYADLAPDAEVTVEANPEDVTAEAAGRWRSAGVNRVSLGSQSFDDRVLAWMHRTHDAAAIPRATDALRAAGIENFSLDLIFAVPPALERDWPSDVAQALALAPPHLSLYGLTIEPHTPLGRWHGRRQVDEAPEDRYETEFLHADAALGAAGLEHYEVSNFGRPGFESRHNWSYWSGRPYLGLGPSAHGFDGTTRRWNVGAYAGWLRALAEGADPVEGEEVLTEENRLVEAVYLGLRTRAGLGLREGEEAAARRWVEQGWATIARGRLRLTPLGWLRLDALASDLTLSRSR